eukprot:6208154-Pleurochrysis_carterae.AAC.2
MALAYAELLPATMPTVLFDAADASPATMYQGLALPSSSLAQPYFLPVVKLHFTAVHAVSQQLRWMGTDVRSGREAMQENSSQSPRRAVARLGRPGAVSVVAYALAMWSRQDICKQYNRHAISCVASHIKTEL